MATVVGATDQVEVVRTPARAGMLLGALDVAISVVGLALAVGSGRSWAGLLGDNVLNNTASGVALGVIGAILVRARTRNPVGRLVLVIGAANALTILGEGWALWAQRHDLPGVTAAAWLSSWVWLAGFVPALTVLLAIYPSGRPVSRAGRRIVVAAWAATAALATGAALSDENFASVLPGRLNPLTQGHGQPLVDAVAVAGVVGALACVVAVSVHTVRRLSRSASPEREQLAWLLASVLPLALGAGLLPPAAFFVVNLVSPLGIVVGILRYRLFDIKVVLRRGLVYGLLTGFVILVYALVVAGLTALVPRGIFPNVLAAATVAVAIRPVYDLLQKHLTRLVYGDRSDPIGALSRVTEGLRRESVGAGALSGMGRAVATALRSPYVSISGADGAVLAVVGDPAGLPVHDTDLDYGGRRVGRLSVAGRGPREPLRRPDLELVATIAGPVGAAVHAAALSGELRASRERALDARESERQRIRRDLHDGLGPSLSGVALGLEAARTAAGRDPVRLDELLRVLHGEVAALVTEVRRIIDDLDPTALGEAGLVNALRAHAEAVSARGALRVEIAAPADLPPLAPRVEVAAYRITLEAVTNAVRHSGGQHIGVRLTVEEDTLRIEVADDGSGVPPASRAGVGLGSMRSRAEALGGTLGLHDGAARGTIVVASLPIGVTW